MNDLENTQVQNSVQNIDRLNGFMRNHVQNLVAMRKDAGFSQSFIADWLKVDRRKIIALESGAVDIELLCAYADVLDIQINFCD